MLISDLYMTSEQFPLFDLPMTLHSAAGQRWLVFKYTASTGSTVKLDVSEGDFFCLCCKPLPLFDQQLSGPDTVSLLSELQQAYTAVQATIGDLLCKWQPYHLS